MLRKSFLLLSVFLLFSAMGLQPQQKMQKIGEAYSGNTINAIIFRASSVTSDCRYRVAAFYDVDSCINLAIQKQGSGKWNVKKLKYKADISDAHNVISIALDGTGIIHMCWGMHASALRYCHSLTPYGTEMTEEKSMIGRDETAVSYPAFFRTRDGGLLFFYRNGGSGNADLVLNRYDAKTRNWRRVQDRILSGEGKRSSYPQYFVDSGDNIHLSWVWRETPGVETNHDMCYASSSDYGETWKRTDGTEYELPVTLSSAEYAMRISQGSELMNQTSMIADRKGHPYIVTYWREQDSDVPQYHLIYNDGERWRCRVLGKLSEPFRLAGGGTKRVPISRPALAISRNGIVWCFFRAAEFGSKVCAWRIPDLREEGYDLTILTDFSVDAWEPSIDIEAQRRNSGVSLFVLRCNQSGGDKTQEMSEDNAYILDICT